jgi:predicted RNA-binding Zn-ribbon protein involved in translation (DUF1610 family)
MSIQPHSMAAVIDQFLPALQYKQLLPWHKTRTLHALKNCRTETMGARVEKCTSCGKEQLFYNSCRNRHCPQCGNIEREIWLMDREKDLLPVNYFHVVFTIPDKLNKLFLANQVNCYNILFRTVNQTMQGFAENPKFLGARIGFLAILHTWGQNLHYHPHLHLLVPAGGITQNNKWKTALGDGSFLFPVEEMAKVFRAKMLSELRCFVKEKQIAVESKLFNAAYQTNWVVYTKQPFKGPGQVLSYLGRYTHRVAISNNRILEVNQKQVTFSWKDYSQNYKKQITTMDGAEFLNRFCLHILPPKFTRIRHYGFLSSSVKSKYLKAIRLYFNLPPAENIENHWKFIALKRMKLNLHSCPYCGGKLEFVGFLPDGFFHRIRAA